MWYIHSVHASVHAKPSWLCVGVAEKSWHVDSQEEAVQYIANTVDRLLKEQKQEGIKRVYVVSTYVIGKERLLVAIHKLTGCKIGVTQQKMDTIKCLDLPGNVWCVAHVTKMDATHCSTAIPFKA